MKSRWIVALAVALAGVAVYVGNVLATTQTPAPGFSGKTLAMATFAEIDSHVKSLRRKVSEAGGDPRLIETVRGVGYRVSDQPRDDASEP